MCEQFNGTLKRLLQAYVQSKGKDWERALQQLLFAYREVPQASTGYSPSELLYGRKVRGPLDLVRESWEGTFQENQQPILQYVETMRTRMRRTLQLSQENIQGAQAKQKAMYDAHAQERELQAGQQVMVLIPVRSNKLQATWAGPYTVVKRTGPVNYVIALDKEGRHLRKVHINWVKVYRERKRNIPIQIGSPDVEKWRPKFTDHQAGSTARIQTARSPLSLVI